MTRGSLLLLLYQIRVSSHTLLLPLAVPLTMAAPTRWCCYYGGRDCRTLVVAGVARGAEMARCHGAVVCRRF